MKKLNLVLYVLFLLIPIFASAKTVYVKPSPSGSHDGSSWANACALWEAVGDNNDGVAGCDDVLWICQGAYTDFSPHQSMTFQGSAYGGFQGNETSLSQRNPSLYVTKITGINGLNAHGNIYLQYGCHINGGGFNVITIDGILFQNDVFQTNYLGPIVRNCTFENCQYFTSDANLTAYNCVFKNGSSLDVGVDYQGNFSNFYNCTFRVLGDTAFNGAGGAVRSSGAGFYNCIFDSNFSGEIGGALYSTGNTLRVENCLFKNNKAMLSGGAIYNASEAFIINSTFINNRAFNLGTYGGQPHIAEAIDGESQIGLHFEVVNDLVTGGGGSAALCYSLTQNSFFFKATNNFIADGSLGGNGADPLLNSDYTLSACSPAINAATNYGNTQSVDLAGNPRVYDGAQDVGAYEFVGVRNTIGTLTSNTTTICVGSVVSLQLNGVANSAQLSWIGSDGSLTTTTSTTTQLNVSPTATTTYHVSQAVSGCTVQSNTITIQVSTPIVSPTVDVVTPAAFSTICAGTLVKVTAHPGTGGGSGCSDKYRYSLDGGVTWQSYTIGSNINTTTAVGVIFVEAQRGGCGYCGAPDWTILTDWSVTPSVTPTISISNPGTIFQGQGAGFTATVTNGGNSPSFQWTRNGVNVGTNSSSYIDNAPVDGEVVACTLTTSATVCVTTPTATASVTVPVFSFTITDTSYCINTTVTANFANAPASLTFYYDYGGPVTTIHPTWGTGTTVAGGNGAGSALNKLGDPKCVYVDVTGNVYIAEAANNRVTKWVPGATTGVVVAGGNGAGSAANQLNAPSAVTLDGAGNIFVVDRLNYRVQEWAPGATSGTTVAGGNGNGSANNQLSDCYGIAINSLDQVFISDAGNNRVVVWFPGFSFWVLYAGGHGAGSASNQLNFPKGLTLDVNSNLYIADFGNNRVQEIGGTAPVTVAGGNGAGSAANQLSGPEGVKVDGAGSIYITDAGNYRVQMWRSGATVGSTVAGGSQGTGATQFNYPAGIFVDALGKIFVTDTAPSASSPYSRVQKFSPVMTNPTFVPVDPDNYYAVITTFDGQNIRSNDYNISYPVTPSVDISSNTNLICPGGYVTFSASVNNAGASPSYKWFVNGHLTDTTSGTFVSNTLLANDVINCSITLRDHSFCVTNSGATSNSITMLPFNVSAIISATPDFSICAGTPVAFNVVAINGGDNPSYQWYVNGVQTGIDSTYSNGSLNNGDTVMCKVTTSSGCTTHPGVNSNSIAMRVSGAGINASGTCVGSSITASMPVTPATLQWLRNDSVIRTVNPTWKPNALTLANAAANNQFQPFGVFVDKAENVYVTDPGNYDVLKFAPGDSIGTIVAGGNGIGFNSNQLYSPEGVYVDSAGNVYVADFARVMMWPPGATSGTMVAGTGNQGSNADQLNGAAQVQLDRAGNLFVLDASNYRVQMFTPGATNGITVAGGNGNGSAANQFGLAFSMYVDDSDNIYVADYGNSRVQKWAAGATSGVVVAGGNGAGTASNQTPYAASVFVDKAGNIYVGDNVFKFAIQRWVPGADTGVIIAGGNGQGTVLNQTYPTGIFVNTSGDIYVADRFADRIQKFVLNTINDTITATQDGEYRANLLSFAGCSVSSNTVGINPSAIPGVSISSADNVFCPGTDIVFTATPVNGGASPQYKWYLDSVLVGGQTSGTYTVSTWNDGDYVYCQMTSNAGCLAQSSANSGTTVLAVQSVPLMFTQSKTLALDTTGNVAINALQVDSGSFDNCGTLGLSLYSSVVGSVCATIDEGDSSVLTAPAGMVFTTVDFASYGTPTGTCGNFAIGNCNAAKSIRITQDVLLGNNSGTLYALNTIFGDPCSGTHKRYYVQAGYSPQVQLASLNCSNVGSNNVVLLGSDEHGNKASAKAVVTVLDITAPVIKTQNISLALDASGSVNISPSQLNNGSTDNCGAVNLTLYKAPAGTICATINENDSVDLTAPAGMIFTSIDFASYGTPTGSCGNFALSSCNASYSRFITQNAVLGNNTARIIAANRIFGDSCFGTLKRFYVQASYSEQTPLTAFNCSNIGANNVVLLANDGHGNISSATAVVTVVDTTAPTAIAQNITVQLDTNHQATITAAQINNGSSDNCGVASIGILAGRTSFTCADAGHIFIAVLLVTDSSGNSSTATAQITVKADNNPCSNPPVAVCQSKTVQLDANGNASIVASDIDGGSTFGAGLQSLTASQTTFTCADLGSNNVTLTVTDINNVTSSCTTTVIVQDTIRPTITCPSNVSVTGLNNNSIYSCGRAISISTPVTHDNCSIAAVTNSFNHTSNASGFYPSGTTNVLWTFRDGSGSKNTCTQIVTVYSCLHITATTTNTICTGTNLGAIQLNVTGGTPPYNYIWSNGTHTANIDSLSAGTYRVTVSDATSGSAVALFTVGTTIPGKPTAPGTITGPNRVCPGTTNTYSVNSVANATSYNWIVPSGATIITGQGTTQLTVKFPNNFISGGVKVSASNCGGTSNASVLAISLTTVPTAPAGISGPTIVCIGDTVTYTSSIVNGATAYNWNIPSHATIISGQGNISVQVKYQAGFTTGAVSVSASNCAGHGGSHSLTIGANHAPGKPRVVNGSSKACNNSTHQYSIAAVNNATGYHWTVPAQTTITSGQGTTSISVLFSPAFTNGSILVDATNCAGNGPSNGVSVVHTVNCGANKTNEDDDAEFAQQESPAFAVSVYPNPFTDQFHLKIETTSGENITYRIYDVTGKVMQEVRSAAYDENIAFGNNFSSGMYFIQVQQGDNIKVLRIIKTM